MEIDSNENSNAQPKPGTSIADEQENVTDLRDCILSYLSDRDDIHFKSQQIGEPELSISEKRAILEEVLNRNRSTFLSRFGHHLLAEQLPYFDTPDDRQSYEIQFYLSKFRGKKTASVSDVSTNNDSYSLCDVMLNVRVIFLARLHR